MTDQQDSFFVGYLPIPRNQRRFLRGLVVGVLALIVFTSFIIAGMQRDPGIGIWHDEAIRKFHGVVVRAPYPTLRTPTMDYLLVGEGKHAAQIDDFVGHLVTISGTVIERAPLTLIEVTDAHKDDQPAPHVLSTTMAQLTTESKPAVFIGEMIDSKCYAGAMKPGDGKSHKACATLCIRGGIPPAFKSVDSAGATVIYGLADANGKPLAGDALEAIVPFIADAVEIRGTVQPREGIPTIQLEPRSIRRLAARTP